MDEKESMAQPNMPRLSISEARTGIGADAGIKLSLSLIKELGRAG